MKSIASVAIALLLATSALADVSLTDKGSLTRQMKAADQSKSGKKSNTVSTGPHRAAINATHTNITLIDSSGLKYFIDTNVMGTTSSSASGAASEAAYAAPVVGTASGVAATSTQGDMFDGYQGLCVSPTGSHSSCSTLDPNFISYNQNGSATLDSSCNNRQIIFPVQSMTVGGQQLHVQRKVFVPSNDAFARWLNIFTNTGSSPMTFSIVSSNNLGSDTETAILSSSNGNNVSDLSDTWVTTGQKKASAACCYHDPRIGHILQGAGATTPLSVNHFMDGSDGPWWGYDITLQPGQTKIIMNLATGQPTIALANSNAARLAGAPPTTRQCMSNAELLEVANFALLPNNLLPTLSSVALAALGLALCIAAFVALKP